MVNILKMARVTELYIVVVLFSVVTVSFGELTSDDTQQEAIASETFADIEKYLESLIEQDEVTAKNEEVDQDPIESLAVEEPVIAKKIYCVGCLEDLNVGNPDMQQFIEQALSFIENESQDLYKYGLVKLQKAEREVINGIRYIFVMDIGRTNCLKESNTERNKCEISENTGTRSCTVEIFEKPGLPIQREVVTSSCSQMDNNDLSNEIEQKSFRDSKSERNDQKPLDETGFDSLNASNVADVAERIFVGIDFFEVNGDYKDENKYASQDHSSSEESANSGERQEVNDGNMNIEAIRVRRESNVGLMGDFKEMGIEDKQLVNDLANVAIKTLDDIDDDNLKRIVVKVVKAEKQLVNGVMYRLTLIVGTTSCDENGPLSSGCLQDAVPRKLCVIHLHRSFVNNSPRVQVVKSECSPESKGLDKIRSRRQVPGGISSVVVSDPGVQKASSFAVSEINNRLNAVYKLVRVKDAGTQVVAGIKTYLTLEVAPCIKMEQGNEECKFQLSEAVECTAEVVEQAWLNKTELVKFSCDPHTQRRKRDIHPIRGSGVLVGAPSPVDLDDPYIQEIANSSLAELDKKSNALYKHMIVRILSADQQVVAGKLTHLKIEVGYSTCRKGSNQPSEDCTLRKDSNNQICNVEIWDRPWLNDRRVNKFSCSPASRRKRSVPGGPTDLDVNDAKVKEMATFALPTLNAKSNSLFQQKITRIISAKRQVVAGSLYTLELETGITDCRKNNGTGAENCNLNEEEGKLICTVKIWDRPWLNKREVTETSCSSPSASRRRRSIPGGETDMDVNDTTVKEMAGFALPILNAKSNSMFQHIITRIISAKSQVVAGSLYTLELEIGVSDCLKNNSTGAENCNLNEEEEKQICTVKIWDRPWLNKREVTKMACSSAPASRHRRSFPGGETDLDVNDSTVKEMAAFALPTLNAKSNSMFQHIITRILSAKSQVVAGTSYTLELEIGLSDCLKNNSAGAENCNLNEEEEKRICSVKIWDRPWLNKREITKMSCLSAPVSRRKRSTVIGGGSHDIHIGIFRDFMTKYNKSYANEEEMKRRFHIFRANMLKVKRLQETEQGTAKYGATQFADLTAKEFKKFYLGLKPSLHMENSLPLPMAKIPDVQLPLEFDWRHYNAVTAVKNQGMCGSCWAFSVTGNIEGQWAIHKGKLLSLSEQELVDCDTLDDGCEGGMPDNAYRAIEKLGGLETEEDYPYDGADEKCHFNRSEVRVTIQGAMNISTNETKMAQWLLKNGPISIGINANAMQFYFGGVSHPWKVLCDPDNLDHGVLIVGFGVHKTRFLHKTLPYWIIKNSWGTYWGEQGYYRVYRGDGTCGVNLMTSSAIVA